MHKLQALVEQHLAAGPGGFLAARVHRILSLDQVLDTIFESRISVVGQFYPFDFGELPKLEITAGFSGQPEEAPGRYEDRPVGVTIRITYFATDWDPVLHGRHPSPEITTYYPVMWDLVNYIMSLLKRNRQMMESNEEMVSPGRTLYNDLPVQLAPTQEEAVFLQDIEVVFYPEINPDTGQIRNLEAL